jgi:hypothetical protein
MGIFTFSYGLFIQQWFSNASELSGYILLSFTSICIALFTTAATIIRQLINRYNIFYKMMLPFLGYTCSILTIFIGWMISFNQKIHIVEGNIILGVGLIAACISTVATTSTKFSEIKNSSKLNDGVTNPNGFSPFITYILLSIPVLAWIVSLIKGLFLVSKSGIFYYISGHVLIGISFVCASLIWLVYIIIAQINNQFSLKYKWIYTFFVLFNGIFNILWGIIILIHPISNKAIAPAYVLIGLGLVCFSISSKVILLTLVWHNNSTLAKRVPLIPIFTAFSCFFLSVFLFNVSLNDPEYYIPSHILAGLGAICFTIFSIVSILESGTNE